MSSISNPLMTSAQQAADQLKSKLSGAVSGAAGGISDRLNALTNTKLAETILTTGPMDELLTVDPLGVSDANILNSLSGKLSGFSTDFMESFRGGGSQILGDLSGLISSNGKGGFSFDAKQLTDRVLSSLGGGQGMLRGLSSTLQSTLTQGVGIPPSLYSQVEGTINSVVQGFQTDSFSDARGLFNLVGQITNNDQLAQFFDVGAEANFLSGIFNEAIRLGVPDIIDVMLESADSNNAANYALQGNLQTVIDYSDLQTAITLINRLGVNQVIADCPTMAQQLISRYRFPTGTKLTDYPARYTELKSVLDMIKPGWGKVNRNGTLVIDLGMFGEASADALLLLGAQAEWATAVKIAPHYRTPQNLITVAKSMYPYALL